ncbi:MAG: biotin/lipoyl-binding protein [Flavobacteriales bacterium]
MKTIYTTTLLTLAILATSCGSDEKKLVADTTAISVKVSSINENNTSPFLTASGTIQAVNSANLSTRMMGYVTNIPVNVGDKVKKGQLLVSINNSDLQAKRSQVNAGIMELDDPPRLDVLAGGELDEELSVEHIGA